ncbi:MAG: hypothetical protein AB8B97_20100 [Granulosicoccus sp.]
MSVALLGRCDIKDGGVVRYWLLQAVVPQLKRLMPERFFDFFQGCRCAQAKIVMHQS